MGRAPCCDKANVKKGPWSPEEDAKLKSYIEQHGTGGNWIALPQKIGLKRCGKSCRLRWLNYLRPNIKHGGFSEEEDKIILSLYVSIGSRWSIIAAQLPGRTDNDIKNYWNTRLKKKLLGKQRRDQQHARKGSNLVIKQEDYKLAHPNSLFNSSIVNYNYNQIPYSPQLSYPYTTSTSNYSNQAEGFDGLNDNTSIRTLLMKIGERYDSTNPQFTSYYNKVCADIPQSNSVLHQVNDTIVSSLIPMDAIITSTTSTCEMSNPNRYNPEGLGTGMRILEGQSTSFPPELEELMSSKPQTHVNGPDLFYGDYSNNLVNKDGSASDTTCGESSGWGEMTSLASLPHFNSECNVLVQGIEQECQFEENLSYSAEL